MRYTPFSPARESSDRIGVGISRHTLQVADDTQLLQELTHNGFHGEAAQTIEHAHPYGFSAHPKKPSSIGGMMRSAVAFMGFLGGSRSHAVAFAVSDRRFRVYKTQEGEVVLHDDQGQWVYHRRNGTLIKVPNANNITLQIDQSSGGGGSQQMGQDATQVPSPITSVKLTKDTIDDTSGNTRNITAAGDITITSTGGKITLSAHGDIVVNPNGSNVYLGGDPSKDAFSKVLTVAGPSINVWARIG